MSVLRVRDPFAAGIRVYKVGDLIDSNDPVVTPGRLALFLEPAEIAAQRAFSVPEQTTAAPGERRTITPPRKKAAPDGP